MRRALSAFREWLELRARLREEHRFHLDQAAADLRSLGFSPWAAKKKARVRFGSRRNLRIALRELGGDLPGLAHLLQAHRVISSPWLQPFVLLGTVVLILQMSPSPRGVLEGVAGKSSSEDRGVVFLSAHGHYPWGITTSEFEDLRSMATVTQVEPYRGLYARARARQGVTMEAVQSEARAKTGHLRFWAVPLFVPTTIAMGPAWAIWLLIALYAVYSLRASAAPFSGRWLLYGFAVTGLHALASLTAWGLANQFWIRTTWSTGGAAAFGFSVLMVTFLGVAAIQCRYLWGDLRQRCPVCLDRLLLPLTEGAADSVLCNPAVTESVCAHGHGVLVESRWSRRFRPQESPLEAVVHL
jgi:hypothetical protein